MHRVRLLKYSCAILVAMLLILAFTSLESRTTTWISELIEVKKNETKNEEYLIDTIGCRVSRVEPFDPRLKVFYKKLKPKKVAKYNDFENMIFLSGDRIFVNKTAKNRIVKRFHDKPSRFKCCVSYPRIYAVEKTDDEIRYPEECKPLKNSLKIEHEYMRISCHLGKKLIYEKFDVKVTRKANVEARCSNIVTNAEAKGNKCEDPLSVMIFGIDSLSRLNFHRQLPETRKVLMEELDAIEFLGYNKAGEHTHVCLMPFLAGMLSHELRDTCGGGTRKPYDDCRFLWDVFGASGYRTAFVEDMNKYALFKMGRKGFRRQPADYYGRAFFNAYDQTARNSSEVYKTWRNVSFDEAVFQWAMEFHELFVDDLHFGHFWISYFSHNDGNTAQKIDPFLSQNLKTLIQQNMLNNTLLILMSDHGMRFGAIRETDIGRFEAKLPMAFFVFPRWFQDKYPEAMTNFRRNAHNRLTTAFDMHQTLKDIANCKMPPPDTSEEVSARGTNLFRNISPSRRCEDAGLDDSVCSCLRRTFYVDVDSDLGQNISSVVFREIKRIVKQRKDICVPLKLQNVTMVKAETETETSHVTQDVKKIVYTVTLFTTPGDGLFEGTVVYNRDDDTYALTSNIKRINRYGRTSECALHDPQLKQMCYCRHQVTATDSEDDS